MNKAVKRLGRNAGSAGRGFTLLEVMIVIGVMGGVVGALHVVKKLAEPEYACRRPPMSDTKIASIMVMDYANNAYGAWMLDGGEGCPKLDGLAKFSNDKKSEDPWRTRLKLECRGQSPDGHPHVVVVSAGRDKQFGTDDDISSAEER